MYILRASIHLAWESGRKDLQVVRLFSVFLCKVLLLLLPAWRRLSSTKWLNVPHQMLIYFFRNFFLCDRGSCRRWGSRPSKCTHKHVCSSGWVKVCLQPSVLLRLFLCAVCSKRNFGWLFSGRRRRRTINIYIYMYNIYIYLVIFILDKRLDLVAWLFHSTCCSGSTSWVNDQTPTRKAGTLQ